ncbi:MAG: hypothetical protein WCJ71_09045 [Candidatus Omnitrophota bacterium]
MSYSNDLKKELLAKIQQSIELMRQIEQIEKAQFERLKKEHPGFEELSKTDQSKILFSELDPEIIAMIRRSHERRRRSTPRDDMGLRKPDEFFALPKKKQYIQLYKKFNLLQTEINQLLVDCKYYPLMGTSAEEMRLLDKEYTSLYEGGARDRKIPRYYLERHLKTSLAINQQEMKDRLARVPSFAISFHLDSPTVHFYRQILNCYVFGMLEACCVLSRAIVQSMTRNYIKYRGFGRLLIDGKKGNTETKNVQHICSKILNWDEKRLSTYNKVCNLANKILYDKEVAADAQALSCIKLVQDFIKNFPQRI